MPFSSSVFTRLASLKRGGGCVNFCCGSSLLRRRASPLLQLGQAAIPSSSSALSPASCGGVCLSSLSLAA